ncbi:ABC-type transport auxiliary lipoprotein family protein [Roseomonas sp. CCTCC AB2023176]|uniref:ABC-type transport auxiliary lipoprotein family protein n=1 Tax=Roseomonas sp. CCTCC AB2023176 TaxID=3342640 RepID=UPI0035D5EEB0
MTARRGVLAGVLALAGCGVINQDYVEPRRYALSPDRPPGAAARPGRGPRRTLLLRLSRAAPGLDTRYLRFLRADGTIRVETYAEWTAPPAEAAEDALRRWLMASGLFAGVLAPGTRADADLTLETELTALHVDEGRGVARAAMSGVLLATTSQFGTRVAGQFVRDATVPVPGGVAAGRAPDAAAAAMVQALAAVLALIESDLARNA